MIGDDFTAAYMQAALWSSTIDESDETHGGEPFDAYFSIDQIALETQAQMLATCGKFQREHGDDLARFYVATGKGPEQGGHDLWLTRNRHGAGFWDRGAGEVGDRLTEAAHALGECDLWTDGEFVHGEGV